MQQNKIVTVLSTDLDAEGGIFCPNPKAKMALWNSHPKVFFDIKQHGYGRCPYCGTKYVLNANAR